MKTKIIKIGNSRGIMLSKHLLTQYKFENEVNVINHEEGILLTSLKGRARHNWSEQFEDAINSGQSPESEMLGGFENEFDKLDGKW